MSERKELKPKIESEVNKNNTGEFAPAPVEKPIEKREHRKKGDDAERLREARKEIEGEPEGEKPVGRKIDEQLLGDFASEERVEGKIRLPEEAKAVTKDAVAELQKSAKFFLPLLTGTPIAAAYDIRVRNFSTHTAIVPLPDGRRAFAVFAHEGSAPHRTLDGVMKHAAGLRMGKVSREDWKKAFEEHARIPLIENEDPHTILMPYIPNVNAYDVIANNHDIQDFGEVEWAGSVDVKDKKELLQNIMAEVADIHAGGIAWGECILPNLIFTKEKRAIMCDPEIRYDDDVPLPEAQARDLKDLILSVCAALRKSEKQKNFGETVKLLLDEYPNDEVIDALKKISNGDFSLGLTLTFWNEKLRTGVESKEEYLAILKAVKGYRR